LKQKDESLKQKDESLKLKDEIIDRIKNESKLALGIANTKYMELKGSLHVRGLIEEYEAGDSFKTASKYLKRLVKKKDVIKGNVYEISRKPSRKELWDYVLNNDASFTTLLQCIKDASPPDRRDTIGERIRDIYSIVSSSVHNMKESMIIIRSSQFYDYQVCHTWFNNHNFSNLSLKLLLYKLLQ
jgi:hypothetical protein